MADSLDQPRLFTLDKPWIRQSFNRAADQYDNLAVLQAEIGQRMMERLSLIRIQPQWIADIGAGTCRLTKILHRQYPRSGMIAVDIAEKMLARADIRKPFWRRRVPPLNRICGDAEQIPLGDASVDMIFSNLSLQWCNQLDRVFTEFRRILKPDGLLLFSTFGPDTLKELRQCWRAIDQHNHINAFIDMHDIGDALIRRGFSDPVMDMEMMTMTYRDALQLMQELKAIGAHNVSSGRPRGLTGRRQLQQVLSSYEQYRTENGLLPASYEVIYGHAWCGRETTRHPASSETIISTSEIKVHRSGQ